LNSPYYYLQQNDVIYVEPNKARMMSVDTQNTTLYISIVSTIVTTAAVLISLLKIK
jgi:polysaccharide export outer membrane protein